MCSKVVRVRDNIRQRRVGKKVLDCRLTPRSLRICRNSLRERSKPAIEIIALLAQTASYFVDKTQTVTFVAFNGLF